MGTTLGNITKLTTNYNRYVH